MSFTLGFRFLALLALCFVRLPAAVPAAVTTDPTPDKNFPADMMVAAIPSHGSVMNGVIYIPAGVGPHPALVFFHGFPGNEQNLDLAQAARRAGWTVLTLHYRGSWGSPGAFSFSHAIEDAAAAVAYLRTPEIIKGARLAPGRIAVVGHSMGGFMAAFTGAHDPAIIGVGLISAWNIGPDTVAGLKETGRPAMLKDMALNLPPLTGCTAESLLDEALAHANEWNFIDQAAALAGRPLLFVNSNDGGAPHSEALAAAARKAGGKAVTEIHFATDHGYNDHRIALQAALVTWLESLEPKAH